MKNLETVKSAGSRPSIYRSGSAYLDLSISHSRIVNIDEKTGKMLSATNSTETFDEPELKRGLKSRHVQLIAIGGAIGTGLFVGSGAILSICGPAALFLAYVVMSTVIYFVMQMLGEMTAFLPLPGNGAQAFVNDFLSESFGFAIGYNYWYAF
jgi:Amino acid transporters